MKTLKGSENNTISLTAQDFESPMYHPFQKVYIYRNGWVQVNNDDILDFTIDFQTSDIHGVVSASLDLTIDDTTKKYHPLGGGVYSDYFSFRRKIRAYIGMKKDNNGDGINETPYTWPYFTGFITEVKHSKRAGKRIITVSALDNCDILNTYKFDNNTYWGTNTTITLAGEVEYSLPSNCKGIFRCEMGGVEFTDWVYNFETNKIALTKDGLTGKLKIYYFTSQNVVDIVRNILLQSKAISSSNDFIYENPSKTIDRVWFDESTSAYEALSLITQLVNYRFWFDGEGKAHFASIPNIQTEVFSLKETDNVENIDIKISDKEFYNGVEVIGEERTRNQYFKKEVTLGTGSGTLDATTVSKEHSFSFSNYSRLRYDLNAGNKNGLTSELNETSTGAMITVTHNPEYSREDTETTLGTVSGTLGVLSNTEQQTTKNHIAATRVKYQVSDTTNRYGLTTSINQKDYWNTEVVVSHDPLRNLSSTITQNIGSKTGYASVGGSEIIVPFTSNKLFGNIKYQLNYDDGWGAEQLTGSATRTLSWGSSETVVIPLSGGHQGQHRWEGTKPATFPSTLWKTQGNKSIPANSYTYYTVYQNSGSWIGKYVGWTAEGYVPNSDVTVSNPIIELSDSSILVYFLVRNNTSSVQYLSWKVYAQTPPAYFNITPLGADDDYARFRFSIEEYLNFCPRSWPTTFTVRVYSKRKPYNVKVSQTYNDGKQANFLAKCDFGTPSITIICQGQEAIPRPYTITLTGLKLIPRSYYLTLYGREVVPELTSKIYSFPKLSDAEITQTGGGKFLTIRNHLIQNQSEADSLAQSLLNHYKNVVNMYSITVSCPPPLEVGDTVNIIGTN